jgi:nitrate/TMAO reductase-like tetraheme cytochrome c subunit
LPFLIEGLTALALVSVALIVLIVVRPTLTAARGGKVLAFLALFASPILITWVGTAAHLEQSKSTGFCLSCHVMEPYGESLKIDGAAHLPAVHYQNNLVNREDACYTCHTTYTMFGDIRAKLAGMKHVYVYYLGNVPEKIELYAKYSNRECLHCHAGARSFEDSDFHNDKELRAEMESDVTSCLDCHESVHAVDRLKELPRWKEAGR